MDSVLKRFIHACFNQDKVQSNPFNKDTEGVIESVRILKCSEFRENVRAFFPLGTKQTDDRIKRVSVKRGLTVVRKVAPKGCLWILLRHQCDCRCECG